MKRIGLIAAIGVFAAASAYAQMQIEPAVPRGLQDSGVQPARELPPAAVQSVEPAVPQLVMDRARGRSDADARRCLQFTSNVQIHRCAERYRSHASRTTRATRASVTRTKASKPAETISSASRAKAADLAKPDMSKAADPAKPVDMTKAAPSPAPTSAAVKPSTTPQAAAPAKSAEQSGQKPPKWTDTAKGTMKSRGDHLPD